MGRRNPNILKLAKQKRQGRRAYLTSVYSLVHVPRSVNMKAGHIPEDAQALFAYNERAKGFNDPFLNAIFPQKYFPPPSDWNAESVEKFTTPAGEAIPVNVGERNGRRYALERAEEERLIALVQSEDVCDFWTAYENKKLQQRVTLITNRKRDKQFFVMISYAESASYAMKSKTYIDRDRALFDLKHQRISWMEFLELPSLELILPMRTGS